MIKSDINVTISDAPSILLTIRYKSYDKTKYITNNILHITLSKPLSVQNNGLQNSKRRQKKKKGKKKEGKNSERNVR